MSLDELLELYTGPFPDNGISVGDYRLEPGQESMSDSRYAGKLHHHQGSVGLTRLEYSLLSIFFMNTGAVISSKQIYDTLVDGNMTKSNCPEIVRVVIRGIRKKLPAKSKDMIRSYGWKGYMLPNPEKSSYLPQYTRDIGRIKINFLEHNVYVDRENIGLTPSEYGVFTALAMADGKRVRHEVLALHTYDKHPSRNEHDLIKIYIANIRRKLGTYASMIPNAADGCYYLAKDIETPAIESRQ